MKFSEKDFENFILNEVKKISDENGLSLSLKEDVQKLEECGCDHSENKIGAEDRFLSSDNFEEVQPEEFLEEATEVKQLSEELSRMKQLLSFNNPLLKL